MATLRGRGEGVRMAAVSTPRKAKGGVRMRWRVCTRARAGRAAGWAQAHVRVPCARVLRAFSAVTALHSNAPSGIGVVGTTSRDRTTSELVEHYYQTKHRPFLEPLAAAETLSEEEQASRALNAPRTTRNAVSRQLQQHWGSGE